MPNLSTPRSQSSLRQAAGSRLYGWWPAVCLILGTAALWGGPMLGDHEVIVAQIARQALLGGDWHSLQYLDTPFLVKPPAMPWLVAALSRLFFAYDALGLPVTAWSARLPSLVAMALCGLVLHRLALSMYGAGIGWVVTLVFSASLGTMLFALNATAEALLTLFCTWAFAEFWWARTRPRRRRRHLARFYVALGLAMLAKGPMPLIVVVLPLAAWWWIERPLRLMPVAGAAAALRVGVRDAWPRLRRSAGRLGLWWGLPLFMLFFVPWMFWAARHTPYAWALWEYEYLDRLQGEYPGLRSGRYLYYLPIFLGLCIPWTLSLPEALASPLLGAYRRHRRALGYAWIWLVLPLLVFSLLAGKKPYYILPTLPAAALLLGPVLHRFFFSFSEAASRRHPARWLWLVAGLTATGLTAGWLFGYARFPELWHGAVAWGTAVLGCVILAGLTGCTAMYLARRRMVSLYALAATSVCVFMCCWLGLGGALDNADGPLQLVRDLEQAGIPRGTPIYWATNRPDGRVVFYGDYPIKQVVDPYKLVAESRERLSPAEIRRQVAENINDLLHGPDEVYLVFQREEYDLFVLHFKPRARTLFAVDRAERGVDGEDWLLVTNVRGEKPRDARLLSHRQAPVLFDRLGL